MSERESKDLALPPNEHAFVMDMTKGQVVVYTGPNKASLSQTDQPVKFNEKTKRFEACSLSDAKVPNIVAPENWYVALKNPALNDAEPHPPLASNAGMPKLNIGHKINIPGPASFALWPGQMARLIQGHNLNQNQYLLIRVYDEESAKDNLGQMVVAQTDGDASEAPRLTADDLVKGKLMVVKGTDVSFYMPPTGIEVVRTSRNQYVRDAVTLERLEYCLLLDQNGSKRYVQGPDVVFPEPTEEFVTDDYGNRKFRAIELNNKCGIYVKVIAPYNDDGSPVDNPEEADHNVGEELFITGDQLAIYFPREEHSIITYGQEKRQRHFGIAIPTGEARYVLHREEGVIRLEKGPSVFLPDPRHEVIVQRILDDRTCSLLYPGNAEALQVNRERAEAQRARKTSNEALLMGHAGAVATAAVMSADDEIGIAGGPEMYSLSSMNYEALENSPIGSSKTLSYSGRAPGSDHTLSNSFTGNAFERGTKYCPPRTITLDTKYDGAVTIMVKEGYAVMLTNKKGGRRVIQGPETALLEYDETPHFLSLSTGKPKSTQRLKETAYLKIRNNPVSDIIEAETSDFCNVKVCLTYRVNFTGDPEKWFSVENYVKLLCHNMRSIVRNFAKKQTVESFYQNSATLLRDLILGEHDDDGNRPGRLFDENGMHIHDVEILDVSLDGDIEGMLIGEQRDVIKQALALNKSRRELSFTEENEELKRRIEAERAKTESLVQQLKRKEVAERAETDLASIDADARKDQTREQHTAELQQIINQAADVRRLRHAADEELKLQHKAKDLELDVQRMEADATNTAKKAEAISADLIAALQSIADTETTVKVAEALGTTQMLQVLGGESVADVIARVLDGSKLGERLGGTLRGGNGRRSAAPAE